MKLQNDMLFSRAGREGSRLLGSWDSAEHKDTQGPNTRPLPPFLLLQVLCPEPSVEGGKTAALVCHPPLGSMSSSQLSHTLEIQEAKRSRKGRRMRKGRVGWESLKRQGVWWMSMNVGAGHGLKSHFCCSSMGVVWVQAPNLPELPLPSCKTKGEWISDGLS